MLHHKVINTGNHGNQHLFVGGSNIKTGHMTSGFFPPPPDHMGGGSISPLRALVFLSLWFAFIAMARQYHRCTGSPLKVQSGASTTAMPVVAVARLSLVGMRHGTRKVMLHHLLSLKRSPGVSLLDLVALPVPCGGHYYCRHHPLCRHLICTLKAIPAQR